jgi:hypothetical protein
MELNSAFDRRLDNPHFLNSREAQDVVKGCTGHNSSDLKDAFIFVADTMDTSKLGAEAIFGKSAKPEHAIAIYDRVMGVLRQPHLGKRREEQMEAIKQECLANQHLMPESSIMKDLEELEARRKSDMPESSNMKENAPFRNWLNEAGDAFNARKREGES